MAGARAYSLRSSIRLIPGDGSDARTAPMTGNHSILAPVTDRNTLAKVTHGRGGGRRKGTGGEPRAGRRNCTAASLMSYFARLGLQNGSLGRKCKPLLPTFLLRSRPHRVCHEFRLLVKIMTGPAVGPPHANHPLTQIAEARRRRP